MSAALSGVSAGAAGAGVLALTLWGEAGSRPIRGVEGVASVVMNRLRLARRPDGPRHFGTSVAGICRAPFQFGCWNPNDARHAAMTDGAAPAQPGFAACRRVAARAVAGVLADATGGATHYHAVEVLPRWAIGQVATAELGGLVFYRLAG